MQKVLVTGAYGFLGAYIVKELKENGYYVIAFGRDKEQLSRLRDEHVSIFEGDFRALPDIKKASVGTDYVVHCGALLKGWGKRRDFIETNVNGTMNVLEACRINNIKRMVYISSPSVYPFQDSFHLTEADYNEGNHLNNYIESKILAEKAVRAQKVVPYSVIRPRGICGIGDKNMFPVLIRANDKIGIPMFQRDDVIVDLCCVENAALAVRLCMEKEIAVNKVYHITNGEPKTLTDLAEEMFSGLNKKAKYFRLPFGAAYGIAAFLEGIYKLFRIYDRAPVLTRYDVCTLGKSQVFDITKAQTELGYKPKITISEMIKNYAAAYLEGKA